MATFYIQLENKLLQISGDLTAENISKALGYVPVSPNVTNELSERVDNITFDSLKDNPFLQDGSGELNIVDEAGNIIAKIDIEGIHSVDFIAGNHKLSNKTDKTYVDEAIKNVEVDLTGYATEEYVNNIDFYNINNNPIVDGEENSLTLVDEAGNIGLKVTEDGLHVKDVIADGHTLSQKADKSDLSNYATKDEVSDLVDMSVVTELQGKVNTLIDTDSDKSVRDIAVDVLTETLVSETASEAYDTLAEMSAWIKSHPEDAAAMNSAIQKNATDITNLDAAYKAADAKVLTDAQEYTDNINFFTIKDNPIVDNNDGNLTFVDETGNIGLQFSNNTILVNDVITPEHTLSSKADKSELNKKQDTLVSGTNIKTVKGQSLLGNGDLEIQEFKTYTFDYSGNYVEKTINQEELNKVLESDKIYIKHGDILVEVTVKNESDSNITLRGYNNSLNYICEYYINIDKINLKCIITQDYITLLTDSDIEDLTNAINYNEVECPYIEDGLVLEGQYINFDLSKITILEVIDSESFKIFYLRSNAIDVNATDVNYSTFIFYGKYTDTSLLKATYNAENQTLTFNIIEQSGGNIDLSNYATEDYVDEAIKNIGGGGGETNMSNYYTKEEIDNTIGDINTILESIING